MAKNSNNTYINTAYLKLLSCFIAFKFESFRLLQLPAQGFEPVGEARLDRAERHAQHRGRLFQRHLVQVVEDDDGAAGRRQRADRLGGAAPAPSVSSSRTCSAQRRSRFNWRKASRVAMR